MRSYLNINITLSRLFRILLSHLNAHFISFRLPCESVEVQGIVPGLRRREGRERYWAAAEGDLALIYATPDRNHKVLNAPMHLGVWAGSVSVFAAHSLQRPTRTLSPVLRLISSEVAGCTIGADSACAAWSKYVRGASLVTSGILRRAGLVSIGVNCPK